MTSRRSFLVGMLATAAGANIPMTGMQIDDILDGAADPTPPFARVLMEDGKHVVIRVQDWQHLRREIAGQMAEARFDMPAFRTCVAYAIEMFGRQYPIGRRYMVNGDTLRIHYQLQVT